MRKLIVLIEATIIFVFICSSCTPRTEPQIGVEEKYINQYFILRAPIIENSFSFGSPIFLEVKNISEEKIIFPRDFNIVMFVQINDTWKEVPEKPIERIPDNDLILFPFSETRNILSFAVIPDLPISHERQKIRIYIIGKTDNGDNSIEIASFTDIILIPIKE